MRAIADNVPIVLTEYGLAILPDMILLELTANGLVVPGGQLLLRDDHNVRAGRPTMAKWRGPRTTDKDPLQGTTSHRRNRQHWQRIRLPTPDQLS